MDEDIGAPKCPPRRFFPVRLLLFLTFSQMCRSRCWRRCSRGSLSRRSRSWSLRWGCWQQLQDDTEVNRVNSITVTPPPAPRASAPLPAAAAAFAAFSSSMALSLASYSSFRAFHSFLLFRMPSNMGWICGWKRENSWKTRWHPNAKEGKGRGVHLNPTASWTKRKVEMFHLVDKRADKVDEAALQLGKLCCLRPVHHGLANKGSISSKKSKRAAALELWRTEGIRASEGEGGGA